MRYYNTAEAAKYLRLSPATLVQWRCMGKGPRYRRNSASAAYSSRNWRVRIYYAQSDLNDWLAEREQVARMRPIYAGLRHLQGVTA